MMDRRELLQRASALLGVAVSSSAAAGVLAGCVAAPDTAPAQSFLSADELRTVTAMSEQIIPRTDTPGAIDAGVPSFVDRMLAGYYKDAERQAFRAGLRAVTTDASELAGKPFADLSSEQQIALMTEYDREAYAQRAGAPPLNFFRMMKELTVLGFCTSEAGATKALRYVQTPGPYRPDVPYAEIGKAWAT